MFDALLVVLPVFGVILLGYVARLARYVTDRMGDGLSEFVNDIAIPFLIFQTLSTARIPSAQPWGYWLSYFGGVGLVWTLSMWIAGRFFHSDACRAWSRASPPARRTRCSSGSP